MCISLIRAISHVHIHSCHFCTNVKVLSPWITSASTNVVASATVSRSRGFFLTKGTALLLLCVACSESGSKSDSECRLDDPCTSSCEFIPDRSRTDFPDCSIGWFCDEDGTWTYDLEPGTDCFGPIDAAPPASEPCAVGAYCRSETETCSLVFNDVDNPACQLTQELRCVTQLWRAHLTPIEIYREDPDCSAPALGDAAVDAGDASTDGGSSSTGASDSGPNATLDAGQFVDAG